MSPAVQRPHSTNISSHPLCACARRASKLACCIALFVIASADQAGVLWTQHEGAAVYDSIGVSKKGFIGAGTWLNEPMVAEFFNFAGNQSTKGTGDPTQTDGAVFNIAISEDDFVAVASKTIGGQFNSSLYKWSMNTSTPNPDWVANLQETIIGTIDVSDDGSTVVASVFAGVSYYEPPVLEVYFFDGATGKEILESRYVGVRGEAGGILSTSYTGDFTAMLSGLNGVASLAVFHKNGSSTKSNLTDWDLSKAPAQAIAISGDGTYVVCGQAFSFSVYKASSSSSTFSYDLLFTYTDPTSNFYISSGGFSFSATGDVLAVGWQSLSALQPQILAFNLPSATPILSHQYPVATGEYQNIPSAVAVSESGRFVAVATWGTQNHDVGTEQLQVFDTTSKNGPVYKLMTPGSMFGVGLTESTSAGVIVVTAGKAVHANDFGNGGDLFAVEAVSAATLLARPVVDPSLIAAVNDRAESTWVAGVNARWAGLTQGDVLPLMGTKLKYTHKGPLPVRAEQDVSAIPASFDARTVWPKCIGAIRDQAQCGSCWAFGAAETLGDRACIATNGTSPLVLSPEYILDCDTKDFGCSGGYLAYAWEFLEQPGVVSDACVPYVAATGTVQPCDTKCTGKNASFVHYHAKSVVEFKSVADIQTAILTNGPVDAAFSVYSDFMQYQSGVYQHTGGIFMGGHSVKIVGWGVSGTVPYWIIANSWGQTWGGLGGYFLFLRGNNQCNLEANTIAGLYAGSK